MQLSQKQVFHNTSLHFFNLDFVLNILKKRDDPHSWCIFETTDSEKRGYINVSKVALQKDPSKTNMVSRPKHCLTSTFITHAFFVSFWVQNTWLVLCFFFYFLSTSFVAYLLLLTCKSIQLRVFVDLEALKRKPQFASSFVYNKCLASFILTSNYIMRLSFLPFNLKTHQCNHVCCCWNLYQYPLQVSFCILRSKINNRLLFFRVYLKRDQL